MARDVTWEDSAKADVRAIDRLTALRILHTLARFLKTGQGDISRLQAIDPPEYRLRVGDYRIRFYDRGDSIHVIAVKHRGVVYR